MMLSTETRKKAIERCADKEVRHMTAEYTKKTATGHLLTTKSFDSDNGERAFILMDRKDNGKKFFLTGYPLMPKAEAIATIDRICK